jgi:predicted nucleotidyltransferase
MNIEEIRERAVPVLTKHEIRRAGVFGSFAKGTFHKKSDVDILVELPNNGVGLLEFVSIKLELQKALGRKVDLGEFRAIRPQLKEYILNETIMILND